MGTRNLTIVVYNQEVKVAQYGQWDGYPEGQGITLLSFLKDTSKVETLKQVLPKVRFQTKKDLKEQATFLKSIGCKNGWMNTEQAEQFKEHYPLNHRDLGGDILESLLKFKELPELVVVNSYQFAADSLFCEWAYVVDLDQNTFEVYKGPNDLGISEEDRFFSLYQEGDDYYPVQLVESFPLENLPLKQEFLLRCKRSF